MMVAWHEVPGNGPVKIRPVRYDRVTLLSRNQGAYSLNKPQFDSHRLTPCPTGRTHDLAVPGTSCRATIILSLRDRKASDFQHSARLKSLQRFRLRPGFPLATSDKSRL